MAETEPNEHSHLARGLAISGFLIQLMYLGSLSYGLLSSSSLLFMTSPSLHSPSAFRGSGKWFSTKSVPEMVLHQECAAESPRGLGIIAGPQAWVRG